MTFSTLGLAEPILRALTEEGYSEPTPIQAQTIPAAVSGRDVIGIAQTGTGKTAAFALPILNRLTKSEGRPAPKSCRVLVLSPTRELSAQILDSFKSYGRNLRRSATLAIGGVPMGRQIRALQGGVDVLVATPGRLLDLMKARAVSLDWVEVLVLDEADRMLDMGFIGDVRRIVGHMPKDRQTLFFSATMPAEIVRLTEEMLRDPIRVSVTPPATTVERIAQRVIHVDRAGKPHLLAELLREEGVERTIVFTRTKHGADRVVKGLEAAGIPSDAIHGNKSQGQRERALAGFRNGRIRTLVATDIAARGIDVDGVSHVVNYDLPNMPESYVHRIGRTARAGRDGAAISLCSSDEVPFLRAIERAIRLQIPASGDRVPEPTRMPGEGESRPARNGRPRRRTNGRGAQAQRQDGAPQGEEPKAAKGPRRNDKGRKGNPDKRAPQAPHNGDDIAAMRFLGKPKRQRPAASA